MKVYVVTYNERISSEGYDDVDKAIAFIKGRHGIEEYETISPWHYKSDDNTYKIHEIRVK